MINCREVLLINNLSDMDKLMQIFELDKNNIKQHNPEIYYALLAIKDDIKLGYTFGKNDKNNNTK